jgi:hypothetical protein
MNAPCPIKGRNRARDATRRARNLKIYLAGLRERESRAIKSKESAPREHAPSPREGI